MRENFLNNTSINTHIPTLQSRGVTVEFDQIVVPPQTVNIPDPNLRNVIAQTLGKALGAPITVADMETLVALHANNKNITNLIGLEHATNLIELNLRSNSIADLWPLVENTGLGNGDKVNVKGNPLSNLSINSHIPTLQSRGVTVEFDQIVVPPQTVNIPDSNLRNAIEQALRKAPGDTITVTDMETLTTLNAINANITNLTGLETATKLTVLDLRDNSISDISPLVQNTGLGNGDKVNAKGNPLSTISINTHIPTLRSRGVTVEFDDQLETDPKKITGP